MTEEELSRLQREKIAAVLGLDRALLGACRVLEKDRPKRQGFIEKLAGAARWFLRRKK